MNRWEHFLYKLIGLLPGGWGIEYHRYVAFVKVLSKNWTQTIPELLRELDPVDTGIEKFSGLERYTTFKLASLLGDVLR